MSKKETKEEMGAKRAKKQADFAAFMKKKKKEREEKMKGEHESQQ